MKVLVTGGAGFIGSELVSQLHSAGYSVVAVDNLRNGKRENLSHLKGVELVEADVRDRETMAPLLRESEMVFHLACLGVRHSLHSPIENHSVNAEGTLTLLSLLKGKPTLKRFVHVSSSEVYGTARWTPMTEEHPAFPLTVYGASKLAGECYARAYYESYRMPVVVLRPFNTFGPRCHHEGDSGEVIPKFMLRCLADKECVIFGDGTQTRDFTYVADMARQILNAGFSSDAVGQTLNLGSGREVSILELAKKIAEVVGKPHRVRHEAPRPGDVLRLCADDSRARTLFPSQSSRTLEDGLVELRNWYEESKQTPQSLLESERVRNWV